MSSQPLDEDGFHSIAWDDAPPRSNAPAVTSPLDDDSEGFETISPVSAMTPPPADINAASGSSSSRPVQPRTTTAGTDIDPADWNGRWMGIQVKDPVKEHEGSKDQYVSYAVRTQVGGSSLRMICDADLQTNLPSFKGGSFVVRRRFQDFNFLRDHLVKNFPACVVPPIPDKHRLEYIKGDRFAPEFVEKRRYE
jgi:sorting nexin-4